ncbi:MAG: hypothetical protein JXA36_01365 [Coriobacteriia bacterium]|nr:hypothetical protein [Coriobacteriia bacterium]
MGATTTNAFLVWFSEWGQVVYIITQILFWAAIAAAALIVALQYKRFVGFKVGDKASPSVSDSDASAESSVEPFVE